MRLIAERLLPNVAGKTYVDKELISLTNLKPLRPPEDDHAFHVYCSEANPGALAIMEEVARERSMALKVGDEIKGEPSTDIKKANAKARAPLAAPLCVTTNVDHLAECNRACGQQ